MSRVPSPLNGRLSILFVIGSLEVGGAERHLVLVAPELRRRGWDVEVFCVARRGAMADAMEANDVRVVTPPVQAGARASFTQRIGRLVSATRGLYGYLRVRRPHIVHCFLPEAYLLGGTCALIAGMPIRVMSRRSLNNYQNGRLFRSWFERTLHRTTHFALGNSKAVVEQLILEGFPRSKVGLIYNGIRTEELQPTRNRMRIRRELGLEADGLVFLMIANLIPYKGHLDVLHALHTVRDKLPVPWTALMVGRDDGSGQSLQARTRDLGLQSFVKWLGSRRDVPDLLAASDVSLLCSHQEGFANAILEAMAAGLPVVATNVGGNAEAVLDGVTGWIVPPRDPARLAAALMKVASDPRREDMGMAGRNRVATCFSLARCVDQYEQCYLDLVQRLQFGRVTPTQTNSVDP